MLSDMGVQRNGGEGPDNNQRSRLTVPRPIHDQERLYPDQIPQGPSGRQGLLTQRPRVPVQEEAGGYGDEAHERG